MADLNSSSAPRRTSRQSGISRIPSGSICRSSSYPPVRCVGRTMPTVPREPLDAMTRSPCPRLFHARAREQFAQPVDDGLRGFLDLPDLLGDVAAAEPVDVEAAAARPVAVGLAFHRGLERGLQR